MSLLLKYYIFWVVPSFSYSCFLHLQVLMSAMSVMTQEDSIELPAPSTPLSHTISPTPVACETHFGEPAKVEILNTDPGSQPMDYDDQPLKDPDQVRSTTAAGEDDEVQFVFSAPRRRRRKRKRQEFTYPPSTLNQSTVPPVDATAVRRSTTLWEPLQRRSLGVLEQLESCHIGSHKSTNSAVRTGSLPATTSVAAPARKAPFAMTPNLVFGSAQETPLDSTATSWLDGSKPVTRTNALNVPDWRLLDVDDSPAKKRRLGTDLSHPQLHCVNRGPSQASPRTAPAPTVEPRRLNREPSMLSPRTNPISNLPPPEARSADFEMGTSDMLWTPETPSTSEDQPSNTAILTSWSDIDWNAFDSVYSTPPRAQPSYQGMSTSMDVQVPDTQTHPGLSHQPRIEQIAAQRNMWQPNTTQISTPQGAHWSHLATGPPARSPFQNTHRQVGPPQTTSPRATTPMNLNPHSQLVGAVPRSFNGPTLSSPNFASHQPLPHSQRTQATALPNPIQGICKAPQTDPADLRRKPSLYKIPAWPSTPDPKPNVIAMTSSQFLPRPQNSSTVSNGGYLPPPNLNGPSDLSKSNQFQQPSSFNPGTSRQIGTLSTSSMTNPKENATARQNSFEIPRARTGRKRAPNLVVDIAETCQDLFPFAEVADRHGVPIKKVFDTFSAIIQLPLLRNADDRRRHGSLGKTRLREYREAKKAMEMAQEADRKAQMKAMRARVDEASKKGKGQPNTSALRKTAIWNNAHQHQ